MAEFVYLYRGGERPKSPAESQQVMQKWIAWFNDLAANVVDRGQPLDGGGKIVKGSSKRIIDGPFAEAKDAVGGFTIVKAKDIAEAADLAKGCPILDRGGDVEIRPIMQIDM